MIFEDIYSVWSKLGIQLPAFLSMRSRSALLPFQPTPGFMVVTWHGPAAPALAIRDQSQSHWRHQWKYNLQQQKNTHKNLQLWRWKVLESKGATIITPEKMENRVLPSCLHSVSGKLQQWPSVVQVKKPPEVTSDTLQNGIILVHGACTDCATENCGCSSKK